uniref:Uncharacterized protein n=1 Tax=Anguilla anguilla TaxID=7936 RepID=A0A0E9Q2I3_ANGAN
MTLKGERQLSLSHSWHKYYLKFILFISKISPLSRFQVGSTTTRVTLQQTVYILGNT